MPNLPGLPASLLIVLVTQPLAAQVAWQPVRALPTDASMVFDEARECLVLAGHVIPAQDEFVTWEWDHADWRDCSQAGSPPPLISSRLVYDPIHRRVLRFASQIIGPTAAETWTYDGASWTQLLTATQPSPRHFFALAHDLARQRTVLFGGSDQGSNSLNDTWEFDGTNWTQIPTPVAPPPRMVAAMVYDEARQEIVLFGGQDASLALLSDTWRFDGVTWQQANPATVPSARMEHAMAFDRLGQNVVMFGGTTAQTDTWEWDGVDWRQTAVGTSPPPRTRGTMATYPDGGVALYGGYCQRSDLWRYVAGQWYPYHSDRVLMSHVITPRMVYDAARERVLWLGANTTSTMETWEYDGRYWCNVDPSGLRPWSRFQAGVAYDPVRAMTVMFGGGVALSANDETWSWNGTAWTLHAPAVAPSARLDCAMAFDPSSQQMLLFGGADGPFASQSSGGTLGDTWLFDGVNWQQLTPANAPTARVRFAMATDPQRSRVLLYGGYPGGLTSPPSNETWEFQNGTWTQLLPAASPPSSVQGPMAFDSRRDVLVLQGWTATPTTRNETWEFDGTTWSQLPVPPLDRFGGALAYDPGTDQMLFKPSFSVSFDHELMQLARDPLASGSTYGSGCSPSGAPLRLSTSSPVYFGNHAFQVEVLGQPNAINLLVLGLAPDQAPLQGCTLLVGPPFTARVAVANGYGFAAFPQQVPIRPELRGVHLYFQAGQLDAQSGLFDFSEGLDLVLGN